MGKKQRRDDGGGSRALAAAAAGGSKKGSSGSSLKKLDTWLDDFEAVSAAVAASVGGSLAERLEAGGGIAYIDDFLPEWVAKACLRLLESIPDQQWSLTAAGDDYHNNNIEHSFLSIKAPAGPELLQKVFRALTLLAEEEDDDDDDDGEDGGPLWTFSAGRYDRGGHIAPHDDRAYTRVRMEDSGEVVECSRRVALIWYLTPEWTAEDGGLFVDYEAGGRGGGGADSSDDGSGGGSDDGGGDQQGQPVEHVPRFNRLVAFTIPRWHAVTPVLTEAKRRYSVFGWLLEQGRLYNLDIGDDGEEEEEEEERGAVAAGQKKKKKKKSGAKKQQQQQQQQGRPPPVAKLAPQRPATKKKKHKSRLMLS